MNQSIQYFTAFVESSAKDKSFLENCINFFPALVYILDLDRGEVISINNKLTEYLGFSHEDLENFGGDLAAVVHDEDKLIYQDALQTFRNLKENEEHTYIARFNKKDGGCIYSKTTGRLVEGDYGARKTAFCIAQNITEHVKVEEESLATRQLFDETEKLILFGTWSWTPRTNVLEWTEGMYDLLEYSKDEVPELNNEFFIRHILPDHSENLQVAVNTALEEKKGFDTEFVIRTKTGREKFVQTKGKPLLDKEGNIKKILGITRDITIKKNFEKERDRNIRELNRSNKELEEFAYVASHDMHEPLRKILTFSERLKSRYNNTLGDDGKLYLDRIAASAGNMRSLIDNLLEFSRISRGARTFTTCDLSEVLNDVVSDQELKIEETSTRVSIKNLPKVEAVATELRQLFNNLISNALKFRRKDITPEIKITAHRLTHKERSDFLLPLNQPFYRIDVADNGIGFDAAYAEKIFEIFQRLHGKSEYSGSGIGLAICKKIVENHGGLIHASSVSGSGSTFSVILPEKQNH